MQTVPHQSSALPIDINSMLKDVVISPSKAMDELSLRGSSDPDSDMEDSADKE
jgi:hypothetical protein